MARLVNRLLQLEAKLKNRQGLVPHSREWFSYWDAKVARVIAGEEVDLSGMTLEYVDATIARGTKTDNDEERYQTTCDS